MVFCGVPSKGCQSCRTRRIKCDQDRPSCSQCSRRGLTCEGYRERWHLMFRDQSAEVIHKARAPKHKGFITFSTNIRQRAVENHASSNPKPRPVGLTKLKKDIVILPNPNICLEDHAVCFFFSNYVLGSERDGESVYEFLPGLYRSAMKDSPLACIVPALGLAGLSGQGASHLMVAAHRRYTSAMRLINRALQDPVVAAQDQTLISVLLLGLYEANTCTTINAITSALKHIGGAMAILEFRGGGQLETVIGFRLFTQLRTQITSLCILQRRAIPKSILSLSALCGVDRNGREDHICFLSDIVAKFCLFRADISSSAGEDTNPDERITRARLIDAELATWHGNLPHDVLPTTVQLGGARSEKVHADYYELYRDISAANLLNHYRTVRILIHEEIARQSTHRGQAEPGPDDSKMYKQYHHSKALMQKLISEICASLPFYMDLHHHSQLLQKFPNTAAAANPTTTIPVAATTKSPVRPTTKSTSTMPSTATAPTTTAAAAAAGGNAILWPLFVAADCQVCDDDTRLWIVRRLQAISAEMRVGLAAVLARILLEKKEVTDLVIENANDSCEVVVGFENENEDEDETQL